MVSKISSAWSVTSENRLPLCKVHTNRIFLKMVNTLELSFKSVSNNLLYYSFIVLLYLSEYTVARQTLEYAYDQDMTKGEYAFIMLQLDQQQYIRHRKNPNQLFVLLNLPRARTCDYYKALESIILLEINSTVVKETYEAFVKEVNETFNRFRPGLYESLPLLWKTKVTVLCEATLMLCFPKHIIIAYLSETE